MRLLLLLFLFNCSATLSGQGLQLKLISSEVTPTADDLKVDPFGNIYYLKGNEIIKHPAKGQQNYSYSDPRLGLINFFTLINPLQPLLYYTDFNTIQILDNRLNFSRSINLLDAGFIDPSLVSYTAQSQILIYDQVSDRLSIYDPEAEKLLNFSPAINQISSSTRRPSLLLSSYNHQILHLPQSGFLLFDALAAFQKNIPYTEPLVDADFNNELLICLSESGILSLISVKTGQRQNLICPQTEIKRIILHNRSLYLWKAGMLYLYKLE
tara:strand:- start:4420 stop:5223 length:804 start_codon:yes stop_codon:yes gene_type:complete